ncbi:isochorismatase family protein, partial [Pseudomonas aeruginosa]|uniref:isochorismatase family protein n=1 Tax=Pseudomonas aeruginosa TaxID=287 RepID=UPI0021F1D1B7
MLIRAATSTLLVVDIQERLLPAIDDGPALVEYSQWLLRVARALDVPVLASEQYSKGLGPTVAALRDELDATQILEKLDFSAAAPPPPGGPPGPASSNCRKASALRYCWRNWRVIRFA